MLKKRLRDSKAPTGPSGLKLQLILPKTEVFAMYAFYKSWKLNSTVNNSLRIDGICHIIRRVHRRQDQLFVHFARTDQILCCFQPNYVRLWYQRVCTTNSASSSTLSELKIVVHHWRLCLRLKYMTFCKGDYCLCIK